MEAKWRWMLVTAIAPIAWGSNYYVTRHALPPDHALYGALLRALPAGLFLLAVRPRRPRGAWWWRSAVLGALNVGAFFALIYVTAQLLPTNVASMIMATSPIALMLLAWPLLGERPRVLPAAGAALGIAGVLVMFASRTGGVDPLGLLASTVAMAMSSVGYILATRWGTDVDVLSLTCWQLIAGGLLLAPAAIVAEGAPPALDGTAVLGFAYVSVAATALAFWAWFAGLRHLGAATVGLVGLLNPVTGVLLGTIVAAEVLGGRQLLGLALVFGGILIGQPALTAAIARWRVRAAPRPDRAGTDSPRRPAGCFDTSSTPAPWSSSPFCPQLPRLDGDMITEWLGGDPGRHGWSPARDRERPRAWMRCSWSSSRPCTCSAPTMSNAAGIRSVPPPRVGACTCAARSHGDSHPS